MPTPSHEEAQLVAVLKRAADLIIEHCDACVLIASYDNGVETIRFQEGRGNLHAQNWGIAEALMQAEEKTRVRIEAELFGEDRDDNAETTA